MAATTVWTSEAARVRLENWYARFERKIAAPVEHRQVPTRLGASHVLLAGDAALPPVVCLHSMRTSSAHLASELGPFTAHFRVLAVDLPGQSVRGPQVRVSLTDSSHADWLGDLFDGLGLARAPVFGVSWGGFVAGRFATARPDRVERLALLVPAGIVNGSIWRGLTGMALPMVRYRLNASDGNLRALLASLITTWDDDWARFMGDSLRDMAFDVRIPPLASDEELRRLTMPLLVIGAADDLSFPGEALVRRVASINPQAETEILARSRHCPPFTDEFRQWLGARLAKFFSGAAAPPVQA